MLSIKLEFLILFFLTKVISRKIISIFASLLTHTSWITIRRYIFFLFFFQIVCLLCSHCSFAMLSNFFFGNRLITLIWHRASPATLWSSCPRGILFSVTRTNWSMRYQNHFSRSSISFANMILSTREGGGVENVCSSLIERRAPFDPFFRRLTGSRRRVRDAFFSRGDFSRVSSTRRLSETCPIRILYLVKGILGGFGTKNLLDSPLDKSTSPFRIASEFLLPPESPLREGGAQKFVGPR